jgi:hypothetical protein
LLARQLSSLIRKVKMPRPPSQATTPAVLAFPLPLCSHPKDEWAKPGNLLKTLPFLPLRNNVSHFSHNFTLSLDILLHFLTILLLSVSTLSIFVCLPGLLGRSECVPGSSCDRPSRHRFSGVSSLFTQIPCCCSPPELNYSKLCFFSVKFLFQIIQFDFNSVN